MVRNILNEELGGHRGSYNPVIITNKEAHMIFGNMNKESEGSSQTANIGKNGQREFQIILCFHSRGQHLCKFIGTKESVYIRKEFNSHRTG